MVGVPTTNFQLPISRNEFNGNSDCLTKLLLQSIDFRTHQGPWRVQPVVQLGGRGHPDVPVGELRFSISEAVDVFNGIEGIASSYCVHLSKCSP